MKDQLEKNIDNNLNTCINCGKFCNEDKVNGGVCEDCIIQAMKEESNYEEC